MEKNGIANAASSFKKFGNTKVSSEWSFNGVYSSNNLPKKIKDM